MSRCVRPWLLPLTPLYAAGAGIAARLKSVHRLSWPVISVGNLSTGGSGKTPLTMELARLLNEAGVGVDILSRGYGRKRDGAMRVNPQGSAEEFGDEPLLMAQQTGLPVYVARQRFEAGQLAERELGGGSGLRVHLLDDGMQHRQLHRDIDILLLSSQDWFDQLLPAGNLREGISAINRATVLAIPADEESLEEDLRRIVPFDRGSEYELWAGPIWHIQRQMTISETFKAVRVAAFCGIADPEQFFEGLIKQGVTLTAKIAFRDHQKLGLRQFNEILMEAKSSGAQALLTTEKDLARLGALRGVLEASLPLVAVGLRTEIREADEALKWLLGRVSWKR